MHLAFKRPALLSPIILLALIQLLPAKAFAQFGTPQPVSTTSVEARSVFAADLDGDGDNDIISASIGDSVVAWYENLDGLGNFGDRRIISDSVAGALSVYATDLDGDEDQDIVAAFHNENIILWYENTDGNADFFIAHIVSEQEDGPWALDAADIDLDGDIDLLSGAGSINSVEQSRVAWHENTDGNGTFSTHLVTTDAFIPFSVSLADFDGDNDPDILVAGAYNNALLWIENTDALGNFDEPQSLSDAGFPSRALAADLDSDGDIDVLASHGHAGVIAMYENVDGLGSFGTQKIVGNIATSNDVPVNAVDLDGDGDLDVLAGSSDGDQIIWFENTGEPFSSAQPLALDITGPWSLFVSDLDTDGDPDVMSAGGNTIAWYELLGTVVSTEAPIDVHAAIDLKPAFPNPFHRITQVEFELAHESDISLRVFNPLGQEVALLTSGRFAPGRHRLTWDAQTQAPGVYFYQLRAADSVVITRYMVLVGTPVTEFK